jgi:RNA recognition motif-containing protein
MNKNKAGTIFVGSLISTITQAQLRAAFGDLKGIGDIKIVRRNDGKFCKGYAFVTIEGDKENVDAILNSDIYHGDRRLDTSLAQGGSFKATSIKRQMEHKLHVKSLHKACNDKDLTKFFSHFGEVKKAFVICNPQNGSSKRFGYVEFQEKEALELVMQAPQLKIGTKKIVVSRFIPKGSNHLQNTQNSNPQYSEQNYDGECSQPQPMPQSLPAQQFQYNEYHYHDDY